MSKAYPFNVKDLAHLLEEGLAYTDEPLEFIHDRYSKSAKSFDEALEFLKALKLVKLTGETLKVSNRILNLKYPATLEQVIKDALLRSHDFEDIHQLILKFQPRDELFTYSPSRSERFMESNIRNLLISLGIVKYERHSDTYVLEPHDYEVVFDLSGYTRKKLSLRALQAIKVQNEKIGSIAEEVVLNFERKRLGDYPNLIKKITHTALLDVTAGYDIESFEATSDNTSRYIEVKAVSPYDFGFEWSIGEVGAAKYLQGQYFLYLLPVIDGTPSINDVVIVQNPAEKLAGSKEWNMQVSGYSVSLKTSKSTMDLDLT